MGASQAGFPTCREPCELPPGGRDPDVSGSRSGVYDRPKTPLTRLPIIVHGWCVMADDPKKKGLDRKRQSQQKHEVAYRRSKARKSSSGQNKKR